MGLHPTEEVDTAPHPRSGRNRIGVRRRAGGRELVKSSSQPQEVWAEGWFYAAHGSYPFAPRCIELDEPRRTVVLELLPGATDAMALGISEPDRALWALVVLAQPLAILHARPPGPDPPAGQPVLPPVALPPAAEVQSSTPALMACLADVQARPRLVEGYESWRRALVATSLTHGDVKLDNVIVVGEEVYLTDWELSGRGDPSVDVGGVVGSMVCVWISALDLSSDGDPERWVTGAALPFRLLRQALVAFADAYGGAGRTGLREVLGWGGFWLVSRALSEASLSPAYEPATMLKVRLADSLLNRPERILPEVDRLR
ncbi:MAG TPA: phosphotransferase [Solirubrobacterales bacterium]|nr:phosphotransferase [Solirubrobacterales bacterium]